MHVASKMCRRSSTLSVMLACCLFYSFNTHLAVADDTIFPGIILSGNQTIVSKEGNFELGLFMPGDTLNYYIGIWYKKISKQTVIWVANRQRPLSDTSSSELKISKDGNLVLLDNSKTQIWSSNSTSKGSKSNIAVLLDTGNLVLRDQTNSSVVIWQSFDHPTDTWVPGGWLGMNKITGEYQSLTSWKNPNDPAPGLFSDSIDPDGINQFVLLWNGTKKYWRSGAWNGRIFTLLPGMSDNPLFVYKFVDDAERRYFTMNISDNHMLTRNVMDSSGQVKQYMWMNDAEDWLMFWSQPVAQCEAYSVCGPFGICDQTTEYLCSCPLGFEPASKGERELQDWSSGCARKTNLQCNYNNTSREDDGFLEMPNVRLPVNSQRVMVQDDEECKLTCLRNCSCTAYSFTGGCLIWSGNVWNLQQLSYGDIQADTVYLRLASSDLQRISKKKKIVRGTILAATIVAVSVLLILWLVWLFRRRQRAIKKSVRGPLIPFKYSELQRMTKNFSVKLGKGGFGSVFKGALSDSTTIAVKILEGLRQGEKQFRSEVSTLGTIRHINLVPLLGFCCEGDRRLLVYEYMPNGSLDRYLIQTNSKILDWKTRYKIILGVARGLAYPYEECRERIIHCDIKPENILLDAEFCPKVADFGMAKLIGHEFSRVLTTMRGTIGHLAPEWIAALPITAKADVYSFGMMLFEVVSGKRNTKTSEDDNFEFFPCWAATRVEAGEVFRLLDENLVGDADMIELDRACKVACWCIQDNEEQRPSMGQVVHILEGVLQVNMPPIPRALQILAQDVGTDMFYQLPFEQHSQLKD